MMRGETSATSVTAEQIIQLGPDLAIEVAKQLRDRTAELAEWDEDDKAGEPPGFRRRALGWTRGCIFAPRAQQGEGAARLRAAPARARRGRLSIFDKTPMTGTPSSTGLPGAAPYAVYSMG